MVEPNAPCPCGSGKKYKKCCVNKESNELEQLVSDELEGIISDYASMIFKQAKHIEAVEQLGQTWQAALQEALERDEIEVLLIEYYLYVVQREQWNRHIVKVLNGMIRSETRAILAGWHEPLVLIGKVVGTENDYYKVEELLGHQLFFVSKDYFDHVERDDILMGLILPDTREIAGGVYYLSDMFGLRDPNEVIAGKITQLASSSEATNYNAFVEQHLLDVYQLVLGADPLTLDEVVEDRLTTVEQNVIALLTEQLESRFSEEEVMLGQMIASGYILREKPSFRKPEIIAAAVFKSMDEYALLDTLEFYSQKEVAEMFGVSVSAMAKHLEPIENVIEIFLDEFAGSLNSTGSPKIAYHIGTDPLMTERVNWEIYCKITEQGLMSVEDTEEAIGEAMREPFVPRNAQEQAQVYAYEAYEQVEIDDREQLGEKAYALNPDNIDALLLKAERADMVNEATKYYKKAIAVGKLAFKKEDSKEPWNIVINRPYMRALFAYGIVLFEQRKYREALRYFQQLLDMNPTDNQNVRHLAIATAIHSEQYSLAHQLIEQFPVSEADEAIYLFLQWLLEMDEVGDSDLLEQALDANPYMDPILDEGTLMIPYPTNESVAPGSIEEAMYIACLLV